jgi:hypothetical protein
MLTVLLCGEEDIFFDLVQFVILKLFSARKKKKLQERWDHEGGKEKKNGQKKIIKVGIGNQHMD